MKILLIDDSKDFRALVRFYLSKEDDYELVEYVTEDFGLPTDDYPWADYDLLLLDYNLGQEENGFDLLKKFTYTESFPPTIILTAEGDEYVAIKAIKLGAVDYLNKVDITCKRLTNMIQAVAVHTLETATMQQAQLAKVQKRITALYPRRRSLSGQNISSNYKLIRKIGQGAMSEIYLAERTIDHKSLVLKLLDIKNPLGDASIERFLLESKLVSDVDSPAVVKIFDHGIYEDYAFIVMEFLSRGNLMQRMELIVSLESRLSYMMQIFRGLGDIHQIGVVHRDMKPTNIMFRGDDSLALTDFGISKQIDASIANKLTTVGKVIGTPVYMSPEQGQGLEVDERTDIYSAGVIFYELLTRKKPFFSRDPMGMIYKHINADIPKLPQKLSSFQAIIDKMMAKDPADRYQSANEIMTVLGLLIGNNIAASG